MEQRLEILKKAREAKAAKKKLSSPMPDEEVLVDKSVDKSVDKPVKKPRAKKEPVKSLDLTEDLHEVKDNEINEMLMPSKQEVEEIKKIKETGNPKKVQIEQEPEVEVEVVYEKAPKKKKKIVRKIIQEESSDDEPDVEIIYEKKKSKAKPKAKDRAPPPPKEIPAPANPFFCY